MMDLINPHIFCLHQQRFGCGAGGGGAGRAWHAESHLPPCLPAAWCLGVSRQGAGG